MTVKAEICVLELQDLQDTTVEPETNDTTADVLSVEQIEVIEKLPNPIDAGESQSQGTAVAISQECSQKASYFESSRDNADEKANPATNTAEPVATSNEQELQTSPEKTRYSRVVNRIAEYVLHC